MEYKPLWPTVVGKGKFQVDGLADHLLLNYDLQHLASEMASESLLDDPAPVMTEFFNTVRSSFDQYLQHNIGRQISDWQQYEMKAWITGHGEDYSMTIHNHSGAHLSAVFYVIAEDKRSGGDIVFSDPRANANRGYDENFDPMFARFRHTPETGDFMIFPSFTYHHVNPYYSNLRICIPVDLYLYQG